MGRFYLTRLFCCSHWALGTKHSSEGRHPLGWILCVRVPRINQLHAYYMIDVILTGELACDHMDMAVAGDHDGIWQNVTSQR